MRLRPLEDRVLVQPLETQDRTPGGILLPDTAKEKPQRGKVLDVGPGKWMPSPTGGFSREPVILSVGNLVCYSAYAGHEIEMGDGSKCLVMNASDVLAVIEQ